MGDLYEICANALESKLDARWQAERGKDGNSDFHYDAGKPRVDLIPPGPIVEIGHVFGYGCKKYGDRNWEEHADSWSHGQLAGSIERHLLAYKGGEDIDPESKRHHLAHLGCDVLMLLALILKGRGVDDRSKL